MILLHLQNGIFDKVFWAHFKWKELVTLISTSSAFFKGVGAVVMFRLHRELNIQAVTHSKCLLQCNVMSSWMRQKIKIRLTMKGWVSCCYWNLIILSSFQGFFGGKVKYCSFGIGFDVNPSFDFEKYCQHFSLNSVAVFVLSNFPSNQFWQVC